MFEQIESQAFKDRDVVLKTAASDPLWGCAPSFVVGPYSRQSRWMRGMGYLNPFEGFNPMDGPVEEELLLRLRK